MPRPIHARIHSRALRSNLQRVRSAMPGARVWAVVKANAYGHGIERVYPGLRGADGFALLDLAEAARLRALGWGGPILLLEGLFEARDLELCARLDLWHVLHCNEQIDMLAAQPARAGQAPQHVFLKINTGMNRLGFAPAQLHAAWQRLAALPQRCEIALMTHFSDADGARGIAHQLAAFERASRGLPGARSLYNSAAILRHSDCARAAAARATAGDTAADVAGGARHSGGAARPPDWVRAGILLYGGAPDFPEHDASHWGLEPAMTLATRLIAVQRLQAGDTVGYGSCFVADAPLTIGIAACGYADGYPRHCGTGTPVLVDGVRTRLLGRVSMDMLALDLTPLERRGLQPGFGSAVTLWGRARCGALLAVDEVAQAAGTLGYELLCALAQRVAVTVDDDVDRDDR